MDLVGCVFLILFLATCVTWLLYAIQANLIRQRFCRKYPEDAARYLDRGMFQSGNVLFFLRPSKAHLFRRDPQLWHMRKRLVWLAILSVVMPLLPFAVASPFILIQIRREGLHTAATPSLPESADVAQWLKAVGFVSITLFFAAFFLYYKLLARYLDGLPVSERMLCTEKMGRTRYRFFFMLLKPGGSDWLRSDRRLRQMRAAFLILYFLAGIGILTWWVATVNSQTGIF